MQISASTSCAPVLRTTWKAQHITITYHRMLKSHIYFVFCSRWNFGSRASSYWSWARWASSATSWRSRSSQGKLYSSHWKQLNNLFMALSTNRTINAIFSQCNLQLSSVSIEAITASRGGGVRSFLHHAQKVVALIVALSIKKFSEKMMSWWPSKS